MGVVYVAYDADLDRRVALKLLLTPPETGESGYTRLQREAQALAKLSHPNVVQVYETGRHNDRVYLAMEYIEGSTLRAWQDHNSPSWREAINMYMSAGRGLAAAHQAGLIHRDFKPANVLVGNDGRPRVLDFGLARADTATNLPTPSSASHPTLRTLDSHSNSSLNAELTKAGTLLGTPAYMAPEQLFLSDTDARCDVYAFSASLWEALYGRRPYPGKTAKELRAQLRAGPPTPPPGPVPAVLGRVLLRGLAFNRQDRFPSMEDCLDALEAALHRPRRVMLIAGAALLTSAFVALALLATRGHDDPAQACAAAGDLQGAWSPAIAEEIEGTIADIGLTYGSTTWSVVKPRLQAYAAALSGAMIDACIVREGYDDQLSPALHEQIRCFDHRLLELRTVIDKLRDADAKILENAVAAVSGLSSLDHCANLERLSADALRRRQSGHDGTSSRWAEAQSLLIEADVADRAAEYERSHEFAKQALAAAEELNDPSVRASALHQLGVASFELGNFKESREYLQRALMEAEKSTNDHLVADVILGLFRLDGPTNMDASAARGWELMAEAKLARVGEAPPLRIRLDLFRAITANEFDDRETAMEAVQAANELASRHREEHPNLYVRALSTLSSVQHRNGDLHSSERTLNRAFAEHIELFGEGHPYQASLLYSIGTTQLRLRMFGEGRNTLLQALEAREAIHGPNHPEVSRTLNSLAAAYLEVAEIETAIPLIERALAIDEEARGKDHPELFFPLLNLSEALKTIGRLDDAERHLQRAKTILASREMLGTAQGILLFTALSDLALARGNHDEALAHSDEAFAQARATLGEKHTTYGQLHLYRAKVLEGMGNLAAAEASLDSGMTQLEGKDDHIGMTTHLLMAKVNIMWKEPGRRSAALEKLSAATERLASSKTNDLRLFDEIEGWKKEHLGEEQALSK